MAKKLRLTQPTEKSDETRVRVIREGEYEANQPIILEDDELTYFIAKKPAKFRPLAERYQVAGVHALDDVNVTKLAAQFLEAFEAAQDSSAKEAARRVLLDTLTQPKAAPALPDQPPELWMKRDDKQETAPDFIKRVYAPWLGQGLTRAHILHLDKSLYSALAKWLRLNGGTMPTDLNLPKQSDANTKQLEAMGVDPTNPSTLFTPETRERRRLYQAALRRLG